MTAPATSAWPFCFSCFLSYFLFCVFFSGNTSSLRPHPSTSDARNFGRQRQTALLVKQEKPSSNLTKLGQRKKHKEIFEHKNYYRKVCATLLLSQNFLRLQGARKLPTNNCGQVRGRGYSDTPSPPLDRRSSTRPSSHTPKVGLTE